MKDLQLQTPNKTSSRKRAKRVLIVDTFRLSRVAVSKWLAETDDLVFCGEADSSSHALKAVARLKPDVVVMEVLLHQDFELIRDLRRHFPRLPILVFSYRDEEWYAPRVLEAGADGFITKAATPGELVDGIRAVSQGRMVLSSQIRERLLAKCVRGGCPPPRQERRNVTVRRRGGLRSNGNVAVRFSPVDNLWILGDQQELAC